MKSISVTIETLKNGNIRATGRNNGTTVAWKDGSVNSAKSLLAEIMEKTCGAHRIGSGYDLTHINLNAAAKAAMA